MQLGDAFLTNSFYIQHLLNEIQFVGFSDSGGLLTTIFDTTWSPANNTDYHLAFNREGDDFRLYIEGVLTTTTSLSGFVFRGTTDNLKLAVGGSNVDTVQLKDIRIFNKSIYTSNFTPASLTPDDGLYVTPIEDTWNTTRIERADFSKL
jgi:hypothetical protein